MGGGSSERPEPPLDPPLNWIQAVFLVIHTLYILLETRPLFDLILYFPVNNFLSHVGTGLPRLNQY